MSNNVEQTWEEIYSNGQQLNKYPWDSIVTFIYRNYPRYKNRADIKILEVGCGSASNLWFAAREGFDVTGIDISESAIEYAKKRFEEDGLKGNFIVSSFDDLSQFQDETFDLILDRGAITCSPIKEALKTIKELNRVLKKDGKMFFNPYSDKHSSCSTGRYLENGLTTDISCGIMGIGDICFYGRRDIYEVLKDGWKIESIQHSELVEEKNNEYTIYADWRVIARKKK